MIEVNQNVYTMHTEHTTYSFRVMKSGHLEHLYYGRKLHVQPEVMQEKRVFAPGNTTAYSKAFPQLTLEDVCLEMSGYGKGDIREPFIELIYPDGSRTTDFLFQTSVVTSEKPDFQTLPGSIAKQGEVEHLRIILTDKQHSVDLELHYYVFPKCDVITRSAKLINHSVSAIRVERLMSLQLDFDNADYMMTTFTGGWTKEMQKSSQKLQAGMYVNASYTGTSSSRANPFFMLSRENTTEDMGECYGFNLIYSGNHYEAAHISSMKKLRIVSGINPASFSYELLPNEYLEAPEAVMTYSRDGYNGMSQQMHAFIRQHIVRGVWKEKVRPILLNSWETSYFDINERKLISLAKAAKNVGIELFVMDDGWFEGRNDDTSSLGDWRADTKKLPNGLKGIADKIKALGLDFGIWVEPEMVNVKSKLYREHPEWVLQIPNQSHSEGRNQRILDLTNREVQDFVIEQMSAVFSSADISYVKWDMNRNFSDYFSQTLDAHRQGEVAHRYVCGLYRCMRELTERFSEILFEGCSAGGNRFDLGILCYFPQIWASDNTDAYCRANIQNSYSYGYPMSVVSAHVSDCPNHQTLRTTPLRTRFDVAAFGVLGYESNLGDMKKEDLDEIKSQIEQYKKWREIFQKGIFYRCKEFQDNDTMEWCVVSEDRQKAVGFLMQSLTQANMPSQTFYAKGLLENQKYHFYKEAHNINIKDFGSLINTAAPIHIKQDSIVQTIASKVIKMPGENEDEIVYGDTLMYAGVKLSQPFRSTGYEQDIRLWKDFDARMYYIESVRHSKS